MTVKINATALGIKKPIEVEESFASMKRTLKIQINANKLSQIPEVDEDETGDSAYLTYLQNQLDAQEMVQAYIVETLGLTEAQEKKLENLPQEESDDLLNQLVTGIMHLEDVEEDEDDETPSSEDDA